jgi:hypothetical protein
MEGERMAAGPSRMDKRSDTMKQYLISVYHPEYADIDPAEMAQIRADVDVLNDQIRGAGRWVFAGGLHHSSTATTLRLKDDDVLTTDGPFAEGKEHVGGFWVIKAPDLDEALEWGRRAARACRVPIEVRPFDDEAED